MPDYNNSSNNSNNNNSTISISNNESAAGSTNPVSTPRKAPPHTTTLSRGRRSARVVEHDPVVAPGYGTRKDLHRLAADLSSDAGVVTVAAVEAIMKARGRGLRGNSNTPHTDQDAPSNAPPASSAWADFMADEGVSSNNNNNTSNNGTGKGPRPQSSTRASGANANKTQNVTKSPGTQRDYELPILSAYTFHGTAGTHGNATEPAKKKAKTPKQNTQQPGYTLLQAGTLDSTIVGRVKIKTPEPYHLMVPTRIAMDRKFTKIFTSCNAVHSIAIDEAGVAYGWGRNESSQLGASLPNVVVLPTELELPDKVVGAALGKSHTILQLADQSLWAVGANKAGQCGVRVGTEVIPNFRKCVVPESVTIVQISCGEDFSVALDSEGYLYSTGSSEYGQLGNGETGEYFIAANKLGFANCNVFTKRSVFCHTPGENAHSSNAKDKVVPLAEDVRIQSIACGKHHVVAVEAPSDQKPRVFSWGSGDYGCLGHGVQADEYFPRMIGGFINTPLGNNKDVVVTAGAHCSLIRTSNGHVYYWGKHRPVGEAVMRPQLVDVLANNQHDVRHFAAGAQTVVCSTSLGQTVAWGQGPHGELGLGTPKSSAKPSFVSALDGAQVMDVVCGYGHTLYLVRGETPEDTKIIAGLAELDLDSVQDLIAGAVGVK
jgi:alpha-tubulin suppressor-like RCC1 family protein